MKLITLLIFLSIVPSGLMAQKKDSPEVIQRQIQYIELVKKSYLSELDLYDASFNYLNSLEKMLIPLCERYEILNKEIETYRKEEVLKNEHSKKEYLEHELASVRKSIEETNRKITIESVAQRQLPSPPDIEEIGRKARLQAIRDIQAERAAARRSRNRSSTERYYVGVFIAKEITLSGRSKKPRRK